MIVAPDVFAVDTNGTYRAALATDWVAHPRQGTPSPLYIGRTLHYHPDHGWTLAPEDPDDPWQPLDEATKTLQKHVAATAPDQPAEGYYELIGPRIKRNPHGRDHVELIRHGADPLDEHPPRTSLYALPAWLDERDLHGILWTWTDHAGRTRYAAVRRSLLPTPVE